MNINLESSFFKLSLKLISYEVKNVKIYKNSIFAKYKKFNILISIGKKGRKISIRESKNQSWGIQT